MGWLDVAEALKKGYSEMDYAGALRMAVEVEPAKYEDEGAEPFGTATNYAMAGDNKRALDWLEKA